jgi:hypothetical protein
VYDNVLSTPSDMHKGELSQPIIPTLQRCIIFVEAMKDGCYIRHA